MADEKSAAEAAPAKPAKSNTILIVVIAVLATTLLVGGAAAFFLLRNHTPPAASAEAGEEHASDAADQAEKDKTKDAAKGKKGKEQGPKGPAIYTALDPPFVVNFPTGQPARFLQISVQLMTRDMETDKLLKDNVPLLRNDLLMLFAAQTYETVASAEAKEDLRKKALDAARAVVKQEGGKTDRLEGAYFTSFVMQ